MQLLGFGVHIRVSAACPEACTQIQARIQTEAFGLGFVHVVALAYLVEGGVLVVQSHVVYLLIGEGAVVYHVADVVDEPGDGHGEPAVVVLRIQRVEVVLFWFQTDVARGVAVAGLGLVGGVELRQGRRTEACRIGGAQVQSAELVHQRYVGSGIILEVLVVDVAYAQYGLQVQGQLYFILCVESEGVHVAGVDVV